MVDSNRFARKSAKRRTTRGKRETRNPREKKIENARGCRRRAAIVSARYCSGSEGDTARTPTETGSSCGPDVPQPTRPSQCVVFAPPSPSVRVRSRVIAHAPHRVPAQYCYWNTSVAPLLFIIVYIAISVPSSLSPPPPPPPSSPSPPPGLPSSVVDPLTIACARYCVCVCGTLVRSVCSRREFEQAGSSARIFFPNCRHRHHYTVIITATGIVVFSVTVGSFAIPSLFSGYEYSAARRPTQLVCCRCSRTTTGGRGPTRGNRGKLILFAPRSSGSCGQPSTNKLHRENRSQAAAAAAVSRTCFPGQRDHRILLVVVVTEPAIRHFRRSHTTRNTAVTERSLRCAR